MMGKMSVTWLKFLVLVALAVGILTLIFPSSAAADSPKIVAIDSNTYVSAALMDDGTLWIWGDSFNGLFDTDDHAGSATPVRMNVSGIKAFSLGFGMLAALSGDGTIWFCGNDALGSARFYGFPQSFEPVPIGRVEGAKSLALDIDDRCIVVLKTDGTVVKLYTGESKTIPVPITDVIAIDAGAYHVAALKADGTVWSWGRGERGTMGNGQLDDSIDPVKASISDVVAISCEGDCTMAVKRDGTAWGWGFNVMYSLGNRTSSDYQATPVMVEDLQDIVAIATGGTHAVALRRDGTVWSWGEDNEGKIGSGVYSGTMIINPIRVIGLDNVKQITSSYSHSMALRGDGSLWAWGRNVEGELGNGNPTNYLMNGRINITGEAVPLQVLLGPRASLSVNVTQSFPSVFGPPQPTPSYSGVPTIRPGESAPVENWSLEIGGSPVYIGLVTDDAIYAYHGNDLYRISPDGKFQWKVTIPDQWKLSFETKIMLSAMTYRYASTTIMCGDDGMLYVYAPPADCTNILDFSRDTDYLSSEGDGWDVIAITPDGKIAWTVPLKTSLQKYDDTSLQAKNGIVYAFHSYNLTLIDRNGSVIATIPDVSDPGAIDEDGNVYVTTATAGEWFGADYREPGSVIESYSPDGTLRWRKALDENVVRQYMVEDARFRYNTLPLYQNGSLYIPLRRGVMVLDVGGNERWVRHFDDGLYVLFELMPVDNVGNVYVVNCGNYDSVPNGQESFIYVISPDGSEVSPPRSYTANHDFANHHAAKDGIVYLTTGLYGNTANYTLDDIATFVVSAYDLRNGVYLWNYTLPTADRHRIVLTQDNLEGIFGPYASTPLDDPSSEITTPPDSPPFITIWPSVHVYPVGDRIYIEYHSATYQEPIVLGQSECVYTSGIFVIDANGSVLSGQQLGTVITSVAVNNGTVYFGTGDGRITATTALLGVASGVAVLATAYLFVKFIAFGYVARARGRIDRNDNRNVVMRFVAANPGCTQYEIARGLNLNLGTVRYHLMILGINHRLVAYRDSVKRVRYFTNAGSFTAEQMRLISLLRREPVRKLLRALAGTQGMSNIGLATACGLPESDVSRLLKELTARGVIDREALQGEKPVYRIAPGMEGQIVEAVQQMDKQDQGLPVAEMSPA
jgi:Alpha-tubulin suppressor and related RCC1 domain-containing proteins